MLTAKIIDNIWSTRKVEALNGMKLMLAEVIGGANAGERLVAVDTISAGKGNRVIVCMGSSTRRMLKDDTLSVDAVVVGIIDEDCEIV